VKIGYYYKLRWQSQLPLAVMASENQSGGLILGAFMSAKRECDLIMSDINYDL